MGEGRGSGSRDEEKGDTKSYDSRVGVTPKKGESYRIGDAGGKNIAGQSREERKAALQSAISKEADAQNDTPLPREQRENAKQYFERISGAK